MNRSPVRRTISADKNSSLNVIQVRRTLPTHWAAIVYERYAFMFIVSSHNHTNFLWISASLFNPRASHLLLPLIVHRSTTELRITDRCFLCTLRTTFSASLSISTARPSVCLFVRKVYCGKTADWIGMPFGVVSGFSRWIGVL